ncbi:MAG: Zn-dependent protease with chaperone function [Bermanella sp.]|jgi:Zn-dependent protease with chaperone function
MDFFEQQAQAKAASKQLFLIFFLVTFIVVIGVDFLIYISLKLPFFDNTAVSKVNISDHGFVNWQLSWIGLAAASVSILIIASGSFLRWLDLRTGGGGLAINLGARSLGFSSKDQKEQQLINVVEEMAIAAGVIPPSIFILDHESSINAFVAGYEIDDNALIVTHGLLKNMNRHELQAVVGHEFSHILNGDNRINIHLMIMIAGFVWVSQIGHALTSRNAYRGSRSYNSYSNKGRQQVASIGIPLVILGFLGAFCGRLIRASVSRKREYLADASAVQFTRNPDSMASALNVIRTNTHKGYLKNSKAEELSHMCISPSKKSSWFSSHPPLESRINIIDDTFIKRYDARERKVEREEKRTIEKNDKQQASRNIYSAEIPNMQLAGAQHLHDVIGTITAASLAYAMSLHEQFPAEYKKALQSPEQAKAMLLYLLLDDKPDLRAEQLTWLQQQLPKSKDYLHSLTMLSQGIQSRLTLPLVELLIPLLKTLDDDTKKSLVEQALILAKWDKKLSLFEICLYSLLKQNLQPNSKKSLPHSIKKLNLVAFEINLIVCCFIQIAGGSDVEKANLHNSTMNIFSLKTQLLIAKENIQPNQLYTTLKKLKGLSPMLKRSLMDVCGDIVFRDNIVESSEYQSLKLMSLLLSCPMPAMPPSNMPTSK